ncbi:MAG: hypothetical protein IPJ48_18170, partial [Propionivibrio sp.]|nr:hypothetical protein [Candidatus Propionivibrio dominans]
RHVASDFANRHPVADLEGTPVGDHQSAMMLAMADEDPSETTTPAAG